MYFNLYFFRRKCLSTKRNLLNLGEKLITAVGLKRLWHCLHTVNVILKIPWKGEREKIRNPPYPWFVLLPFAAQPIIMLVNGVGRCGWGSLDVFMKIPPVRSVVKMESDSSPQPGGLKGQEIKSVTAACGLETCCRIENGSITTSRFCATRHFSKYYVMSEFNLHSSVLNFHCKGSVYSLMLSIYYPAIAKYHSKLLILLMPGGENTWRDMELIYEITGRLHLPFLFHSFYSTISLSPFSLISNFSCSILLLFSLTLVFLQL